MTLGIIALSAAICSLVGITQGIMQARVAIKAIDAIVKNPEAFSKIRTSMILGIALSETTAIYALLVAIFIVFMIAGPYISSGLAA